jgi:DNA processing protein
VEAHDQAACWLALRDAPGIGDVCGRRLIARFGDPRRVLAASAAELGGAGFGAAVVEALAAARRAPIPRAEAARIVEAGARLVPCTDAEYPEPLGQLPDAPLFLIVRGAALVASPAVAVVGARRASPYGKDVASRLAEDLARAGLTVVSGLARGIDGAAHEGALRGDGLTIAVLGSGIDVVYPPEHRDLAARIARAGTLVSERPLGAPPLPAHFPARNRIIAGMTQGTIVVEAADRSGALITARIALEHGREVFAVPGRIDSPLAEGPHRLIQEGAKLVARLDDVLGELVPALTRRGAAPHGGAPRGPEIDADDRALLAELAGGPVGVDRLVRDTGLGAAAVLARVLDLELRGVVTQLPGKQVALIRR